MAAGVLFSLLAAIILNSGNLIQKHAVSRLPEFSARRSGHLIKTVVTSRQWMLGFVLCLVGVALQIMAFALAPIAVVQSIFNAGIVLLIVLSRLRLGERLHRNEWIGLAIVVGSVISISASLSGPTGSAGLAGSGTRVLFAAAPTLVAVVVIVLVSGRAMARTAFCSEPAPVFFTEWRPWARRGPPPLWSATVSSARCRAF